MESVEKVCVCVWDGGMPWPLSKEGTDAAARRSSPALEQGHSEAGLYGWDMAVQPSETWLTHSK
jgi:hypothetical protein